MTRRKLPDAADTPARAVRPASRRASVVVPSAEETTAPAEDSPLIRIGISVRWRDLDAFHHVNNSTFLTYIEEARLQWFQSLHGPWLTEDTAPVLAASQVNYRRPIEWPEELTIELFTERVGTTSLTLAHRIMSACNADVLYSDGSSVLVWIDRRDGKPAPLPEPVRQACPKTS